MEHIDAELRRHERNRRCGDLAYSVFLAALGALLWCATRTASVS
jgi:hypothetical protein